MRRSLIAALAGLLQVGLVAAAPPEAEFFEKRVRPVLGEHCLACHGPKKQQAGLRLDSLQGLLKGADSGPVVIPGDAENSPLVHAIRQTGPLKMPPKGKLKPEAIEALTAWVKMGVPWPESPAARQEAEAWKRHWAFQPVRPPPLPAVQKRDWPATPIDCFILAKLEEKGLAPSPRAEARTLIRRATFDLLGLPPTSEEVEEFVQEHAAQPQAAWEKLVDRLLASPHYGERWGRYWLDVARYADTKGYVLFEDANYPWAWTYRDYVIRAFNADLPYDQFILQQLAADQLFPVRSAELTAMGFLTAGGRFMNNQHDVRDDRIDVVTRGLLGLTVSCARCHDHKFDPIPTQDYYALYGVFANSVEPAMPPLFEEPPQTEAYAAFEKEHQARQRKLDEFIRTKHAELTRSARQRVAEYLLAAHALRDQPTTEEFMLLADGGDLNPTVLLHWRLYLDRTRKRHDRVWAVWHAFAALPEKEFAAKARELAADLLRQPDPGRPVNALLAGAVASRPPQTLAELARRYGEVLAAVDKLWQDALKQAADQQAPPPAALADPLQEELRQVLYGPAAPANLPLDPLDILPLLPDRPSQAKLQELRKAVLEWRTKGPGAPPRAMTLEDVPQPRAARVFLRGNPNHLGEAVPRQFLAVLAGPNRQPFQHGSGRLDLARAIARKDNPLTARVLVNRLWLHHFGQGLVRTPSDFGLRSAPPSHPELLDFLATYFTEGGWSIKKLHRLILLSAAYQQESLDRDDCRRLDPENLLLWKMNRRRLDFEALRDALLAVSGRLDRTVGGPPVKDILSAKGNRRTVYGFLDRLNLPGLYRTFDFPSPDTSSPQRAVTTVAPQALFLMNNPFVLDCARRLLQRPEVAAEQDTQRRVERLYQVVYGRAPNAAERDAAREYLEEAGATPKAWQSYAQALLLANEFVFLD
jgi:mono/diheme cytochrome c family protein